MLDQEPKTIGIAVSKAIFAKQFLLIPFFSDIRILPMTLKVTCNAAIQIAPKMQREIRCPRRS